MKITSYELRGALAVADVHEDRVQRDYQVEGYPSGLALSFDDVPHLVGALLRVSRYASPATLDALVGDMQVVNDDGVTVAYFPDLTVEVDDSTSTSSDVDGPVNPADALAAD